jgi:hypothetical protein
MSLGKERGLLDKPLKYTVLEYNPNRKRTKTIERRINSMLRRGVPFVLKTSILTEEDDWFVNSGGWVSVFNTDQNIYRDFLGHVKNCLPFLGGPYPVWKDRPQRKRKQTVKRSLM